MQDGWGSYPESLQKCTAFQQIWQECYRMYAIFQQHSTEEGKVTDGFFATPGFSWLLQLGPKLALAAFDSRVERSRKQIVPRATLDELEKRARNVAT